MRSGIVRPMHEKSRARWALVATAALFSTGGAAIKYCTFSGAQVAGLRTAIAALAFLAMVPAARRLPTWREWLVGCAYAGSLVFYTLGNKRTTAANAIFLQSTAPLYVLLLGPWLLREKIRGRDLVFLAIAGVGLALFFLDVDAPQASAPAPLLGNMFALASGLCWALTLVGLRWLGTRGTNVSAVVAGNIVAFLLCSPQVFAGDPALSAARVQDWVVIVWLGVFQVGLAYVLLTSALKWVPAFEASILLLLEPVLNPVWAWIVHGERPGTWALAGGAILLGATLAKSRFDARAEPLAVDPPGL
ncbi:MAG TPA: DMT family transporter [Planctomycetota bacterium]|jgi:drug/metabolite transporter (DMT)-like permease|nr:DMT family transporter [Planctomycetota bacterium]